ncbi:MAG: hypothetical protein OIF32_07805 [Campylobacterales bacterium]|nr:hypothetical protein [Campylobacterales bacterium]
MIRDLSIIFYSYEEEVEMEMEVEVEVEEAIGCHLSKEVDVFLLLLVVFYVNVVAIYDLYVV